VASWSPPVRPDPRPRKREKASPRDWAALHEHFAGQCCVTCGQPEIELHHAVPRSQGGDDVKENLVPLCHTHHQILENHSPGWERVAAHVRAFILARESRTRYVLDHIGQARFDARYPCPPFLAIGDLDRYRSPDVRLRENEDEI
jgi:5-methylcytosine-specific restriction endonuclease McrA